MDLEQWWRMGQWATYSNNHNHIPAPLSYCSCCPPTWPDHFPFLLCFAATLSSYFHFISANFLSYRFLHSIMLKILLLIHFWHLFSQFLLSPCLALLCYTVYSIVEILGIYIHPSLAWSLSIVNYTLVMMMKAMFVSWWESSTSLFLSTYLLQSTINLIWCADELPL